MPYTDARPEKVSPVLLGQYNTEAILRKHIERHGGVVEYSTELRSFTQHADSVEAVLATKVGDTEKLETVTCHWLVGSDGAKGMLPFRMLLAPNAGAENSSKASSESNWVSHSWGRLAKRAICSSAWSKCRVWEQRYSGGYV